MQIRKKGKDILFFLGIENNICHDSAFPPGFRIMGSVVLFQEFGHLIYFCALNAQSLTEA